MAHRRHGAALGQRDAAVSGGPVDEAGPREFRAPAQAAGKRRERELGEFAKTLFRADVVDEDQLAAGLQDAHELVERALGIGHGGDDILRDHRVEEVFGEGEVFRVHHREHFDIGKPQAPHARLRLAQHRLGNVDAADFCGARIVRERQAGADADVEDAAADPVGLGDGRLPSGVEHLAEHEIIDRRPAAIGLLDPGPRDVCCHAPCPARFFRVS